jgi:hypothetical protein
MTPRQTLPRPTTGPAAVPGNAAQDSAAWFAGAFNQAMDKYQNAARLGAAPAAAVEPTAEP